MHLSVHALCWFVCLWMDVKQIFVPVEDISPPGSERRQGIETGSDGKSVICSHKHGNTFAEQVKLVPKVFFSA